MQEQHQTATSEPNKVYVFRENNYGIAVNEIDASGDVVVLSTLEKAVDILRTRLIEHCSPRKSCVRQWFIGEDSQTSFFADCCKPTEDELCAFVDAKVNEQINAGLSIRVDLYPECPQNELESLAYIIEKKIIDNIDIF